MNSIILTVFLLINSCSAGSVPQYTIYKLSSGKEVKLISKQSVHFSNGSSAYRLIYMTDYLNDKPTLRKEVEEIWEDFRKEVEQNGYTNAAITAQAPPEGIIIQSVNSYGFTFKKIGDSNWEMSK